MANRAASSIAATAPDIRGELLEGVMIALPYPSQITDVDLNSEPDSIRFTWRGDRFRVSDVTTSVEQVQGSFLAGSNLAILMEAVIKRGYLAALDRKAEREKKAGK